MRSAPERRLHRGFGVLLLSALATVLDAAQASEGATNVYLLGSRGPVGGVTPPPGLYFQNDYYHYEGELSAARRLQIGGQVIADVKARIQIDLLTPVWVTPVEVLGGNLGFSATLPFGRPGITAGLGLDPAGPFGPIGRRFSDADINFGDPFVTTFLGWHAGNLHWSLNASANIPSGAYEKGELSNVALNRPAFDLTGAVTYLDGQRGFEISLVPGITFNGQNEATDYTTGTEFHLEGSASVFLTKDLTIGAIGYHYRQLTDDTGSGNRIGPFKGRASALGGTVGYTFKAGDVPVSTRVKIFREFDVENRLESTAAYLTVSLPLWVAPNTQQSAPR